MLFKMFLKINNIIHSVANVNGLINISCYQKQLGTKALFMSKKDIWDRINKYTRHGVEYECCTKVAGGRPVNFENLIERMK